MSSILIDAESIIVEHTTPQHFQNKAIERHPSSLPQKLVRLVETIGCSIEVENLVSGCATLLLLTPNFQLSRAQIISRVGPPINEQLGKEVDLKQCFWRDYVHDVCYALCQAFVDSCNYGKAPVVQEWLWHCLYIQTRPLQHDGTLGAPTFLYL